jgi:hypothetical protein
MKKHVNAIAITAAALSVIASSAAAPARAAVPISGEWERPSSLQTPRIGQVATSGPHAERKARKAVEITPLGCSFLSGTPSADGIEGTITYRFKGRIRYSDGTSRRVVFRQTLPADLLGPGLHTIFGVSAYWLTCTGIPAEYTPDYGYVMDPPGTDIGERVPWLKLPDGVTDEPWS